MNFKKLLAALTLGIPIATVAVGLLGILMGWNNPQTPGVYIWGWILFFGLAILITELGCAGILTEGQQ